MFTRSRNLPKGLQIKTRMNKKLIMFGRLIFGVGVSVLLSEVLLYVYKKYKNENNKEIVTKLAKKEPFHQEVLFFIENSAQCLKHYNYYNYRCPMRHCAAKNLRKVVNYINSAKKTLEVCIYFFTCKQLMQVILRAHEKGVAVRIVLDSTMSENASSSRYNLRESGIQIRMKRFESLMHHKFVIIDHELLITGSTNWTRNAFFETCRYVGRKFCRSRLSDRSIKSLEKLPLS
ncbi:uncharacterized protein zuc isoform X2 [Prorops nasuta]|uniref:uncharacterized protein zuc isoform X2 n=1 Tax=Prorops nasuta TaxID=863751 RepID=UPI0034CF52EA